MPVVALAWLILPGKEESWRRFAQELSGSRREEYEESRQRRGIHRELMWFTPVSWRGSGEYAAFIYLETDEPERFIPELAASQEPFDRWYKRRVRQLHSLDLSHLPGATCGCELVLAWRESLRDPIQDGSSSPASNDFRPQDEGGELK